MKDSQVNVSRRNLIKLGAGAVGTGLVTVGLASQKSEAEAQTTRVKKPKPAVLPKAESGNDSIPNDATPDEALKALMAGNDRFISGKRVSPNQSVERLREVALKQTPFAAILGCADSRVAAEILFDRGLGDLFVCRVAGNVATSEEIGSLEFGTLVLGAKVILVLGHERCGAVDATIKGASVPGRIGSVLEAIRPAVLEAKNGKENVLEDATKSNVKHQVKQLQESSVLSKLVAENKLKIVGGYYDLDTAKVTLVS